jgi:homoserine kinase
MPMLAEMRAIAKQNGALGLVISGAGPTLCAICCDEATTERVAQAICEAYAEAGILSHARHTRIASEGARILRQK